jgi:hypothetical protein
VLAGSDTANKVFNITWNTDSYDGAVWLSYTPKTGAAATVGPIPFDANEETVIAAFEQHAGVAVGDVLVTRNGVGDYNITCIEGNGLSNTPALATSANTLKIPDYFQGTLSAATAGVDDLLAGATSVTTVFEVEVEEEPLQSIFADLPAESLPEQVLEEIVVETIEVVVEPQIMPEAEPADDSFDGDVLAAFRWGAARTSRSTPRPRGAAVIRCPRANFGDDAPPAMERARGYGSGCRLRRSDGAAGCPSQANVVILVAQKDKCSG